MTPEDPTETLLTESLDRHAADAPADHDLLTTVHSRLRRRRTSRTIGTAALAAVAIAATITATQSLNHNADPADTTDGMAFRWESYKTVQVQVPANWTHFSSNPAPCGSSKSPVVGRLSPWLTLKTGGCAQAVLPLKERHEYVWFDNLQKPGIKEYDAGWTKETREVGGVHVSVLTTNDALRKRILDSAVPLTDRPDAYGCEQNGYLPNDDDSTDSPTLGKIDSVDVCEYWTARDSVQASLIAGSSVDGKQATVLAEQIAKELKTAPKTTGETPLYCLPLSLKIVRLTLHGPDGTWSMLFKQQNCTNRYYTKIAADLRLFSIPFTDLVFTGVHNPEQVNEIVDASSTFTPPPR